MGNRVPVPDEKSKLIIDKLKMETSDIKKIWSCFLKYDKDHSGTIDIQEFYKMVGEEKSVFGDAIFELCECENSGALDFGEFLTVISTYNMFGKKAILQFCFYIFDKDKNGYIEKDELNQLVELLHSHSQYSNTKKAMLGAFDSDNDGKMTFKEFEQLHEKHPQVLYPAFRMQEMMMMNTMGVRWWTAKRASFADARVQKAQEEKEIEAGEKKRVENLRNRQIRKKMGFLQYYINIPQRNKYIAQVQADIDRTLDEERAREEEERDANAQGGDKTDKWAQERNKVNTTATAKKKQKKLEKGGSMTKEERDSRRNEREGKRSKTGKPKESKHGSPKSKSKKKKRARDEY